MPCFQRLLQETALLAAGERPGPSLRGAAPAIAQGHSFLLPQPGPVPDASGLNL